MFKSLIQRLTGGPQSESKGSPAPRPNFTVSEGIAGVWPTISQLIFTVFAAGVGVQTMHTSVPLSSWGFVPDHMPSRYCETCAKLALEADISLGCKPVEATAN